MNYSEIENQAKKLPPDQQKKLAMKLLRTLNPKQKAKQRPAKDSSLPLLGALHWNDDAVEEPRPLTDAEKEALLFQLERDLSEGAYAPLEETDKERRMRLASIPPADAMTGVIHL